MATYILGAVGTALGGPLGGMIGAALGGLVDRYAIAALTPNTTTTSVGPRLVEMSLSNSVEGTVVPRVVGRSRLGGQVIWATQFKETRIENSETIDGGGKGGGGGGDNTVTTVTYEYSISFALAFCEGTRFAQLGRVWLDGNETDLSQFNVRWYSGSEYQSPDPLIEAKEGAGNVPAYRGVSYLVFEDLPLKNYGNRIPQVTAEVIVPLDCQIEPDDLQSLGKSFHIMPGTGEASLATQTYKVTKGDDVAVQNVHNNFRQPDGALTIDQLNQYQNELQAVALQVAWFGNDLRADRSTIRPKVQERGLTMQPSAWSVAGYTHNTAEEVSRNAGGVPNFGGTPSDQTVLEMINYLSARDKKTLFYPSVVMDIPPNNGLLNPYANNPTSIQQSLNGYAAIGNRNAYDFHVSDDGSQLRVLSFDGSLKKVELFNLPIPYETQYAVYVGTESSGTDFYFNLPSHIEWPYNDFFPFGDYYNLSPNAYQPWFSSSPNFVSTSFYPNFCSSQHTDVGIVHTAGYFLDNSNKPGEPNGFYIWVKGPGINSRKYVGPYLNTFYPFENIHNLSGSSWQWHWSPDGHHFSYSCSEFGGQAFTTYLEQPFDISGLNGSTVWDGDLISSPASVWIANAQSNGARPGQFSANGAKFYGFRWGTPWYIDSIDLCKPWKPSTASLSGCVGQPPFPWVGRVTCDKAPGLFNSPDKTGAVTAQIDAWFNKYRTMILHYANLVASKNIYAFLIGADLVGLTTLRSTATGSTSPNYPAVDRLVSLAAEVKAILPSITKVGYAAHWTEFHSHRPNDASGDVTFNLDPLWSSPNIDFVGINNFMPVSDWRDGSTHLDYDAENGPVSEYDPNYIKANIEGGEHYDWIYASEGDRRSQTRTPIADAIYNKPWVFRQKDIRNWWENSHRNRPSGTEAGANTAWTPKSKPIFFTSFGCPAVNKGTNQPNATPDPRSSENRLPYFSNGQRDDAIQRIYLEATLQYWRDNSPASSIYFDKMVRPTNMFMYTWDARPYSAYPADSSTWADNERWYLGHWLTGRIDGAMLPRLVANICRRVGLTTGQFDVSGLYGPGCLVRGFYIANQSTERAILETLAQFHQFNAYESEGKLKFRMSINAKTAAVDNEDLVLRNGRAYPVTITRKQEIDLPKSVKLTYLDELNNFQPASVDGQKSTGNAQNVLSFSFPIVSNAAYVRSMGITLIHQAWQAREFGDFVLPPSYYRLEPGDGLFLPVGNRVVSVRVDQMDQSTDLAFEFSGFDTTLFAPPVITTDLRLPEFRSVFQSAILEFIDLPLVSDNEAYQHSPRLMAYANPWPGGVNLLKSDGVGGFVGLQTVSVRGTMGVLRTSLSPGPTNVWDRRNSVDVEVYGGGLTSVSEELLLATGGNTIAVKNGSSGLWEVLQFANATLVTGSPGVYRLSGLLRGLLGTADAMANGAVHAFGSRWVLLSASTVQELKISKEQASVSVDYRWGPTTYPSTDDTYVTRAKTGTLRGLRPYAPCDSNMRRNSATGALTIDWKRCTRLNGDGWEQTEVPLIETYEQYQLVILSGPNGTVKRTAVVTSPTYVYSLSDQITDFGSAQTQVYIRVAQYGEAYGAYGSTLEEYVKIGSST